VWQRLDVVETAGGKGVGVVQKAQGFTQVEYPGLGKWPPRKEWWRKLNWMRRMQDTSYYPNEMRLPGWRKVDLSDIFFPITYLEWAVAIAPRRTRQFLWTVTRASGIKGFLFYLYYNLGFKWLINKYFIQQDRWAVERVDTTSEKLRGNDIVAIRWRKLAARARHAQPTKL
jgi:hypothetical protein